MLKIRLQRVGRKHEPSFRLVLTDSKNSTKSGRSLETLGNYDARRGEKAEFKSERILYWLSKGAQTSTTVHNLLVTKDIVKGKKKNSLPLKVAIVKDAPVVAETPARVAPAEAPVEKETPAESPAVDTPAEEPAAPEAKAEEAAEVVA